MQPLKQKRSFSLTTFAALTLGAPLALAISLAACGDGRAVVEQGSPGAAVSSGAASGGQGGEGEGGGGDGGNGPSNDLDGDGLDDSVEQTLAESYLPFLSLDPDDGCPLGGIVYRLRPHPMNEALILIVYDHLFENDCGLAGHVGDNEVFGATIDPTLPPPAGILALRAVTHQGEVCEKTTECGSCPGLPACATATKNGDAAWPVVFSSKDKHASYVEKGECNFLACFDSCSLAATEQPTPLVNAGEPGGHLTENLTEKGFITAANGWTKQELFNFNPWDPAKEFGGAGNIADDLDDEAFVPPACK